MRRRKPHTALPKPDPAGYVPGTPTMGQYQPKRLRAVDPPLLPGLRSVGFGRDSTVKVLVWLLIFQYFDALLVSASVWSSVLSAPARRAYSQGARFSAPALRE